MLLQPDPHRLDLNTRQRVLRPTPKNRRMSLRQSRLATRSPRRMNLRRSRPTPKNQRPDLRLMNLLLKNLTRVDKLMQRTVRSRKV